MTRAFHVPWYWFRVTFARRWSSYLAIAALVGLLGGVSLASVAAARRTEASYNVFLASTNPSDMNAFLYTANVTNELSRLPLVRHVATSTYSVTALPLGANGAPKFPRALTSGEVAVTGTLNAEYVTQDVTSVIAGRRANPKRPDEFVMTALAERLMGWHVGQVIPMGFYTNAQSQLPDFGTAKVAPRLRMNMHLVGTVVLNDEVVLDEVDRYPALIILSQAVTRPFALKGSLYDDFGLQLDHGARDVSKVEREIIAILPRGTTYTFHVTALSTGEVNRSIEPEAIALGVFGLIALLATLIIAGGIIARVMQSENDDIDILRALGAAPATTTGSRLFGLLGAIVAGGLIAVGAAVALSPLAPIGPVRAVYPDRGISVDWFVLGVGFAVIVVIVGSLAILLASRRSSRVASRKRRLIVPTGSRAAQVVANAGAPLTTVVGVRFALEPGRDRDAVPVRSAILGAVLAVAIVVATLTFGNSLNSLITHPALFGWNWNYALTSSGNIPPQSTRLLTSDPLVSAWTGYGFPDVQIDGTTVPVLLSPLNAKVAPPLLSGHGLKSPHQIVLGAATMQLLHKHLGDTVTGGYGTPKDAPVYVPPMKLTIVGTATLPSVGSSFSLHPSMGVGAIIYNKLEPPAMLKYLMSPYPTLNGPQIVFVRMRPGVSPSDARANLQRVAAVGNRAYAAVPNGLAAGNSVQVVSVQYPAEIENYRSIGLTPAILAMALALGAVVALGLTLAASVRRRRRDLALLRALGFTSRQLIATVAWQASVAAVIGVVVGIPLGIVAGRWLWTLFARNIYAVPAPAVPVASVMIVAASSLVLANVVAALPGRSAARTSTAQVLRDE